MLTCDHARIGGICILAMVILTSGAVTAVSEPRTATQHYASATPTGDEDCQGNVKSKARISHSSIHAVDDQITTDEPASVSGEIVTPQSNQCVVVVQIIMTVPTDMYVSGTQGISSGGQGTLSSTFRLAPGETKSIAAQVYGSSPGTRVITSDFLYYPAGHPSKTRRLSGYSVPIEATEENMPGENTADSANDFERYEIPTVLLAGALALGTLHYFFASRR